MPPSTVAIRLAAQLFASGTYQHTDADDLTRFDLDRAELGAEPSWGERAGGELRLETVRSADPQSALGVDGNSLVVRAKRAWMWGRWTPADATVELRAGLVPEPWIEAVERGYGIRALAPTVAEDAGLIDAADLGVAAVGEWNRFRLTVMVGNGEGRTELEQNHGKDTSAVLSVHVAELGTASLDAHAYGRDGSVGIGAIRAHRAAAAVTLAGECHEGGVEAMRAWGVGDRTELTAWATSAWGSATVWRRGRLGVAGRAAYVRTDDGDGSGQTASAVASVWHDVVPGLRVFLAGQIDRSPDAGAALPGDAAATDATRVLLVVAGDGHMEIR
jgi:hypothetical protein